MVSRNALEKLSERANLIWAQMQDAKARNDNNSRPLQTEEAAKTALVLPFIQALGYDVFDHSQVVPEFTADFFRNQARRKGRLRHNARRGTRHHHRVQKG